VDPSTGLKPESAAVDGFISRELRNHRFQDASFFDREDVSQDLKSIYRTFSALMSDPLSAPAISALDALHRLMPSSDLE
jgi:hypothetical protein